MLSKKMTNFATLPSAFRLPPGALPARRIAGAFLVDHPGNVVRGQKERRELRLARPFRHVSRGVGAPGFYDGRHHRPVHLVRQSAAHPYRYGLGMVRISRTSSAAQDARGRDVAL
jgi:hypothetical protein